jgi:septal ring factor EnvC (AmiA/AmiB activator)
MRRYTVRFIALGILALGAILTGCTPKATEEQLKQIADLRHEIASLDNTIKQKQDEKARLASEVASRESEAKKCADDRAFVQDKLSKWPDCWPDWHPAPPPPPPTPESEKPKKHKKTH